MQRLWVTYWNDQIISLRSLVPCLCEGHLVSSLITYRQVAMLIRRELKLIGVPFRRSKWSTHFIYIIMCISCIRRTIFLVISTLVSFIVLRKGSNLILFAFLASSVLYLYASRRIWGSGFCLVCLLVKFAKAFFHLPKWFCQIRKGIFLPSEMVLSNSQRHFSALRNGSVKFAKALFHLPKCLCQFRNRIFPMCK